MKNNYTIYYLLLVLLIMGAFASMAQNSYGFVILGVVATAFGLLFLYQTVKGYLSKPKNNFDWIIESACLAVLAFIFALRIFHIYFPYVEWILVLAGLLLIFVYIKKMRSNFVLSASTGISVPVLLYYLSLILFLLSLIIAAFTPVFAGYTGISGFIILVIFLAVSFFRSKYSAEGEPVTVFKLIANFTDRSVLLLCLFFLFSLYIILTKTNVLPCYNFSLLLTISFLPFLLIANNNYPSP